MDIILYNIGVAILLLLVGYFVGSIPNAIWIGKVFFHKDPRNFGSGNAGGTNAGRVFGKKIGVLVILLDGLKAIIPLYVAWAILTKVPMIDGKSLMAPIEVKYLNGDADYVIRWPIYWITTIGCSLGHCMPLFANFKGGKNVSCFFGTAASASWAVGFIPGIFFFIVLKIKKYVSLSSISSSWFSVLLAWIWAILIETRVINGSDIWFITYGPALECNYVFAICLTFGAAMLTYYHKPNIRRLLDGTERKITWMK